MSRTRAAGRWKRGRVRRVRVGGGINMDEGHRQRKRLGVERRGGGPDEAPAVYRKLEDVLDARDGAIGDLQVHKPVGGCMAGGDEYDPYKDCRRAAVLPPPPDGGLHPPAAAAGTRCRRRLRIRPGGPLLPHAAAQCVLSVPKARTRASMRSNTARPSQRNPAMATMTIANATGTATSGRVPRSSARIASMAYVIGSARPTTISARGSAVTGKLTPVSSSRT